MEARDMDIELEGRWEDIDRLLLRPGALVGPGFEPSSEIRPFLKDDCRILVIGAGGLGCELLKDLALSGFGNIDVIDMDTIDVSNLNRQFLFRPADVGKAKATVAAKCVMSRVAGVKVTPHFGRIEDKDPSFYREFNLIVMGLDSLEARSYINSMVCGFLEYDSEGNLDLSSIIPMVDGGTEGFKGHARVILPGVTPCFHCTLWLFPPQTKFPLCTLAETPRSPAHCIEYAHLIQWGEERPGESFDSDSVEHMQWIFNKAQLRAKQFSIQGVTLSLTQGVVKNIIPAIASTNAITSAMCALEALKIATMCAKGLNNYTMYVGTRGVYTHTVAYERDTECIVCSPGLPVHVSRSTTLQQFIDHLLSDPRFSSRLSSPSITASGSNLYLSAPPVLEEATRPNLSRPMGELLPGSGGSVVVNDKKLTGVLRIRMFLKG